MNKIGTAFKIACPLIGSEYQVRGHSSEFNFRQPGDHRSPVAGSASCTALCPPVTNIHMTKFTEHNYIV